MIWSWHTSSSQLIYRAGLGSLMFPSHYILLYHTLSQSVHGTSNVRIKLSRIIVVAHVWLPPGSTINGSTTTSVAGSLLSFLTTSLWSTSLGYSIPGQLNAIADGVSRLPLPLPLHSVSTPVPADLVLLFETLHTTITCTDIKKMTHRDPVLSRCMWLRSLWLDQFSWCGSRFAAIQTKTEWVKCTRWLFVVGKSCCHTCICPRECVKTVACGSLGNSTDKEHAAMFGGLGWMKQLKTWWSHVRNANRTRNYPLLPLYIHGIGLTAPGPEFMLIMLVHSWARCSCWW